MNFFSIFFIENELFSENVKKGVRSNEPNPNGRTAQPTHVICISIEADFCALQNDRDFFEFQFSFRCNFFQNSKKKLSVIL